MLKQSLLKVLSVVTVLLLAPCREAVSQHPIEIERSAASGEYLQALAAFDKLPARRATATSVMAAGRSAWALGLNDRASREFDRALRDPALNDTQRARLLVSRGAIEFQENRAQVSALFAERAVQVLRDESPLRSQAWLLWGESLSKLNAYGAAEEKYLNALKEGAPEALPDTHYKLGKCRMHLGKLVDARGNFESVPLQHEMAPGAIRNLALIALEEKRYPQAVFWLEQGRQSFPDSFLDSWVDYAMVIAAANVHDRKKVLEIQDAAARRYAPSDYWYTLLNSAAEAYLWSDSRNGLAVAGAARRQNS